MTQLKELQRQVGEFIIANDMRSGPAERLLDILSELGEVGKEYLKGSKYGRVPFVPGHGWGEELGDLLFCLLSLAHETDVDLEQALRAVQEKYKGRLLEKNDPGSGR